MVTYIHQMQFKKKKKKAHSVVFCSVMVEDEVSLQISWTPSGGSKYTHVNVLMSPFL